MKKILALLLSFCMVFGFGVIGNASTSIDANYTEAAKVLKSLNIMVGDEQGNFNPDKTVTRAEMAKILCAITGSGELAPVNCGFADVPSNHWASGYISVAKNNGWIEGYGDGNFGPNDIVLYEQAIKLVMSALNYDIYAEENGGYPMGWLMAANEAEVTRTGATGAALQNLSKSVKNAMKNGVGRPASEVGEMVADLNTRFGVTGKELEKLVDEFDQFSDVTGVDTKQSIESLADVMAKWNISATETDDLMDELVYASQASGLGVNDLMSALKNGQSTFDAFGMSITESIGFLSQLKTQGIDSASALSALKIGMAKFAASGKDVDKEFQKVSEQIKNATSDSEALQIAVTNFGAKGGSELVKVFKNNGLDSFISQLENAQGTLNKTAEVSRTSADAFQDLKAQIQATFFSGATDSYITQIIDEVKIGFTEIDDDAMYNVFNKLYKAVQICVNSINALIHGDWETLWDYAKLVVLKLVNSVSEALQKMVDDLGIKVNVAAGVIGGLATGFGILTGNLAVAAAGVGVAVGTIIATNKTAMEQVSKDTQAEIDKTEKEIIARTQKNAKDGSEKLLKDLKRTSSEVKNEVEATGETVVETTGEVSKTLSREVPKWLKNITKGYEEISDSFEAFGQVATNTLATAAEVGSQAFGDMFSMLGEELVSGEVSFQNYAATAVEGISKVLTSLGSELLALSVARAANYDYERQQSPLQVRRLHL